MNEGLYLFCLTPGDSRLAIDGAGIDEAHPLFAQAIAGVTAILSAVSLADFCGPEAGERLANLAWVAPRALRHEQVIMAIMRQAPVLPVRFGSVFSSPEALTAALEQHRDALARFFRETTEMQEWTLKAFVDKPQARARLLAARLAAENEQLAGLTPGARYFQEQKIKGGVDRELTSWLQGIADGITFSFHELFSASREGRLLAQELTTRSDEMFFHADLLVPIHAVERLQGLATEWNASHAALGLELESSGPWPPYHFTPVLDTQG